MAERGGQVPFLSVDQGYSYRLVPNPATVAFTLIPKEISLEDESQPESLDTGSLCSMAL